jgi:hypothetical protein
MWLSASPPGYPGFNAPRRSDRAATALVAIAVALLIGAGLGGASVFAIVAALTAAPSQEVGVAANKTTENRQPAGRVAAAAPVPDPSTGAAAGANATTMTASTQAENLANQPQTTPPPSTTVPAEQAQVTPPAQAVKPWPDALSRAHRAEAETAAPDQTAPAVRSAAPPAATNERDSADGSQPSERREVNGKNAAGKTADRAISESRLQRQAPPNNLNEADRRWASPSRDARRAGVEPRERDDADREGDRPRNRDQWRGGFFSLFSLGGNWRDRRGNWEDDRDD